ncbi:MAG TPA: M64 family metallopeptidase [Phenylobacterium sp.]
MATGWLSIPAAAMGEGGTADHAAAVGADLHAQWRDGDGKPLGASIALGPMRTVLLEHPGAAGAIQSSRVPLPPILPDQAPEGASALSLHHQGQMLGVAPQAALWSAPHHLGPPRRSRIGAAAAALVLAVVGERFDDAAAFESWVQALHDWVMDQPPFPDLVGAVAFELFYWRSDTANGMFHTDDSKSIDGRLFYGDRELARQLLQPFVGGYPLSLILINSTKRGGAGGQPGYSAWASVSAAPGEAWQAIVLHEIGHGFGLADEYVDDNHASDPVPAHLEPNVAADPVPSLAPWADRVDLSDNPAPSCDVNGHGATAGIGTFQGARYRRDFYRPGFTCLMRDTREPFCAVCCDHITARVGS